MSLSVFNNDGLELVVNTDTNEAFATVSGYARMSGISKSAISRRVAKRQFEGVNQNDIFQAEIQTAGGLQRAALLIPAEIVFEWMVDDNPRLAKVMGKAGANLFNLDVAVRVDDGDVQPLPNKKEKARKPYPNKKEKAQKPYVYFILDDSSQNVKIGKSDSPEERLKNLQTANASNLILLKTTKNFTEKYVHDKFSHIRIRGEWFRYTDELKTFITAIKTVIAANGGSNNG
jgi:hypothetical protein